MTSKEIKKYNVFQYSGAIESMTKDHYKNLSGYEMFTTFANDLAIAEWFGIDSVKDTFNRVMKHWLSDVKYFGEFVLVLNSFCWRWYEWEGENSELGLLYHDLYYKAHYKALETYKGEDAEYYFNLTD